MSHQHPAIRLAVVALILTLAFMLASSGLPVVSFLAGAFLVLALGGIFAWLLIKAYQAFLWKVGRRLAFSYFLIGVLPIPMVALLALGVGYVLATFFLGHLYRDAASAFQSRLVKQAEEQLEVFATRGRPGVAEAGGFAFDYYRLGERVGGAGVAPGRWPEWLTEGPEAVGGRPEEGGVAHYVVAGDGSPTLAVAVEIGELGVTAVYVEDLAAALRKEGDLWVEIFGPEAMEAEPGVVVLQDRELRFRPLLPGRSLEEAGEEKREFFQSRTEEEGKLRDRPILVWPQLTGPLLVLASGDTVARQIEVLVTATPRMVIRRLVSASSEQNLYAWLGLTTVTGVLLTLYAVAVLVAMAMIFGLSRAVNRLSRATAAVQRGDFSVRIPVRRRDQLGALQRSYNEMAGHLEQLVAAAAQKEILEKELAIARELQESLLPRDLPQGEAVEFATLFQPSAAIGGDYFDILRLDEERLAVVIADVSGHGLSSGLRMAMLKAALLILVEEEEAPAQILRRLDGLVRANQDQRFFVTATLAWIHLADGTLDLINAGHPPTYLLRRGEVREILLPGSPLGGLGESYGRESIQLQPDDLVVWLSDGFIEAPDPAGEPFGYERVIEALAGDLSSPVEVRNRLLAAVEEHTAGRPADDDCTLVVMRYRVAAKRAEETAVAAAREPSPSSPSAV